MVVLIRPDHRDRRYGLSQVIAGILLLVPRLAHLGAAQSKYVPRILAAWGILTYLSLLALAFISILFPNHPAIIETVVYSVGAPFEVVIGLWLLFKGVTIRPINGLASA